MASDDELPEPGAVPTLPVVIPLRTRRRNLQLRLDGASLTFELDPGRAWTIARAQVAHVTWYSHTQAAFPANAGEPLDAEGVGYRRHLHIGGLGDHLDLVLRWPGPLPRAAWALLGTGTNRWYDWTESRPSVPSRRGAWSSRGSSSPERRAGHLEASRHGGAEPGKAEPGTAGGRP